MSSDDLRIPVQEARVIDLIWNGPQRLGVGEPLESLKCPQGHCVYQIYGTHAVFGAETLLYIGQAMDGKMRAIEHFNNWILREPNAVTISFGHPFDGKRETKRTEVQTKSLIDFVEAALIQSCTPPYNAREIDNPRKFREYPPAVIVNLGYRHRLPQAISNLWSVELANYASRELSHEK